MNNLALLTKIHQPHGKQTAGWKPASLLLGVKFLKIERVAENQQQNKFCRNDYFPTRKTRHCTSEFQRVHQINNCAEDPLELTT